jgi:hypothetical protein
MNIFGRIKIVYTEAAELESEERLFPFSRHRSKRVYKKLVKRFGGVFKMKPGAFLDQKHNTMYIHPSLKAELEAKTKAIDPTPVDCFRF